MLCKFAKKRRLACHVNRNQNSHRGSAATPEQQLWPGEMCLSSRESPRALGRAALLGTGGGEGVMPGAVNLPIWEGYP